MLLTIFFSLFSSLMSLLTYRTTSRLETVQSKLKAADRKVNAEKKLSLLYGILSWSFLIHNVLSKLLLESVKGHLKVGYVVTGNGLPKRLEFERITGSSEVELRFCP